VFSWNDIDVIFLIKKLHLCHSKRTPGDALAFLLSDTIKDLMEEWSM
jgi:hypothetical protein